MSIDFNTKVIESTEYRYELDNLYKSIKYPKGANETVVRNRFEDKIKFFLCKSSLCNDDYAIADMFGAEKVTQSKDGEIWFVDSDFKNIIIEYKRYKKLNNKNDFIEAENQLKKYLLSEAFKHYICMYGFLFDGENLHIYEKNGDFITKINNYSGKFSLNGLDFFIRCLVNYNKKEVNPYNLKEDFSILTDDGPSKRLFLEILKLKEESSNKRTTLLFTEWEKMFRLSEKDSSNDNEAVGEVKERRKSLSNLIGRDVLDSKKEYDVLFALHTTYSILIKLIAIKAAKEVNYNGSRIDFNILDKAENDVIKEFLIHTENGNIYKQMGITNMIEGDFFSWYTKEPFTNKVYAAFRDIFSHLGRYENFSVRLLYKSQDFFRELYENCIPKEIRHSFGEYYTPFWLADNVVTEYLNRSKKKIYKSLDPTCGSGTFVITNINKITQTFTPEMNNREKLERILSNCYGIDLNPLAVLGAKINYFMNICHLYDGSYNIELPIYLGDSSYMPETIEIDGVKCISYDFFTDIEDGKNFIHFSLPLSLINNKNFILIMDNLEDLIIKKNREDACSLVFKHLDTTELTESVKNEIMQLIDKLIDLENKNLNSIWLRIFANYLKAASIDNFDLVAGNPPWVQWSSLPDTYRDKLKISCKDSGIFSDDKNVGGNNLNICALIAMKCIGKYVNIYGELSFLMPQSILFNKSFEGFRRFDSEGKQYYLKSICDWSKAGKPFDPVSMKFCTFTFGYDKQNYSVGIKYKSYIKKPKEKIYNSHTSFIEEKDKFLISEKKAIMLTTKSNNPFVILDDNIETSNIEKVVGNKEYIFRKGLGLKAEVHKLVFVENDEENDSLAVFNTFEINGGKFKKLTKNKVKLEKKFVKPLLESPSIDFYENTWNNLYTIFPYRKGSKTPIPMEELEKEAPYLARYLKANRSKAISGSKFNDRVDLGGKIYGIIRTGLYCYSDNFVCIRDNSHLICSAVQTITTHWGETVTPVFDGHVSYIAESKNGYISEDEMFYITGIMNTPYVKLYIENSSDSQSIGTKFDIKLPYFDNTNEEHNKIAKLSKNVFKKVKENNSMKKSLTGSVNSLSQFFDIKEHSIIDWSKINATDNEKILLKNIIKNNEYINKSNLKIQEIYIKL